MKISTINFTFLLVFLTSLCLPGCGNSRAEPSQNDTSVNTVKAGPKPGERMVVTIDNVEYPFRWCPPGTFMMGSPESEPERFDDETQHEVTLTQGFWMLETQVTQEMWMGVTGRKNSFFTGVMKQPVDLVSWESCQSYIRMLNELNVAPAGYQFSLPTEAQWEYACRAGTTTTFHFGDTLNGKDANCHGRFPYGTTSQGPYREKPLVVGLFPVNDWGLYNMHGNVFEWCMELVWRLSERSCDGPCGTIDRQVPGTSWWGLALKRQILQVCTTVRYYSIEWDGQR